MRRGGSQHPATGKVEIAVIFDELANSAIECASAGVCAPDCATPDFRRVRRPVYPLDTQARPSLSAA